MMLDAVAFDLGGTLSPTFVLPDASGLVPLTLPEEFLREQNRQQMQPSPDAINRFEAAMSAKPNFPSSIVESLVKGCVPDMPQNTSGTKVENKDTFNIYAEAVPQRIVEPFNGRYGTQDDVSIERMAADRHVVSGNAASLVKKANQPVVVSVLPSASTGNVAVVEKPVSIAVERSEIAVDGTSTVEKPMVAPTVVPAVECSVGVPVDKKLFVVPPETRNTSAIVTSAEFTVVAEKTPVTSVENPVIIPSVPLSIGPAITENLVNVNPVGNEEPTAVSVLQIAPSEKTVAIDNGAIAVDKTVVASVEKPAGITAEAPVSEKPLVLQSVTPSIAPAITEDIVNPVNPAETEKRPAVSVLQSAPAEKTAAIDNGAIAVDKPLVASVEKLAGITAELPVSEKPLVLQSVTPSIALAVTEDIVNPVNPAETEKPPAVSVLQSAPAEETVAIGNGVIVADKPIVGSVEKLAGVTVELPVPEKMVVVPLVVPSIGPAITENLVNPVNPVGAENPPAVSVLQSAPAEKTVAIDNGAIAVDKPVITSVERPAGVTAEIPVPEKRVVVPPVAPSIAPAITEDIVNPVNPAETEKPPAVSVLQTAPAEETVAIGNGVIVADKPVVGSVEKPAGVTAEIPVPEKTVVVSTEQPKTTVITPQNEPTIVTGNIPYVSAEKPMVVTAENPTVAIVEEPIHIGPTTTPPIGPAVTEQPVNPVNLVTEGRVGSANPVKAIVAETDSPENEAVASMHVVAAPVSIELPAAQNIQSAPEVAASARTVAIVETVNQIVEAVVGQLLVTPGAAHGECEVKITLKPTVLDGSEITMSSKDGTLTVCIMPATQEASATATAALPRLEIALAEHAPAFHHVSIALTLKKGSRNEAV